MSVRFSFQGPRHPGWPGCVGVANNTRCEPYVNDFFEYRGSFFFLRPLRVSAASDSLEGHRYPFPTLARSLRGGTFVHAPVSSSPEELASILSRAPRLRQGEVCEKKLTETEGL